MHQATVYERKFNTTKNNIKWKKHYLSCSLFIAIQQFHKLRNSRWHLITQFLWGLILGSNYIGIVDAEARYYPYRLNNFRISVSTDIGLLTNSADFISKHSVDNPSLTPVSILLVKPCLTAEMEFGRFAPYAGIGYSFFNFMSKNIPANEDTTTDGLNLNLGLKYNLFQHFFVNVNFDYIRCRIEGELPDISYNRDIFLLRAGIGYSFWNRMK